uniref:Uncharacterized protein n=1 Tax=Anguilla anguilla TaxID=7936 RepID=A0A0E9W906_ANGAN
MFRKHFASLPHGSSHHFGRGGQ